LDWGRPGTARWRRKRDLHISQAEIAARCRPETQQPAISRFEKAEDALTYPRAKQLAPAYFPELWKRDAKVAINSVWEMWFATVAECGSTRMKQLAVELQANWTQYPWEEPATGLFSEQAAQEVSPKERLAELMAKVEREIVQQASERAELQTVER
jgi:hypothetical protein